MSTVDRDRRDPRAPDDAYPTFELAYSYDDQERPSEVTLFPTSDEYDLSTNWITIDTDHTIGLDELR